MATDLDFIEFVCESIRSNWTVTYKKMFGEYMVYVNAKPVLLVCNNTVYATKLEQLAELCADFETGIPYKGAKEHYILDIENHETALSVITILEKFKKAPKPKKKA